VSHEVVPELRFQRRKRELQEEIDAHLQMRLQIEWREANGRDGATSGGAGIWKYSLVQDVTRDHVGPSVA